MDRQVSRALLVLVALIVAIFPAFFCVFNAVFSDIFTVGERVLTFVLVSAAYVMLGALFGFAWPELSYRWGIWLSIPAIAILIWYSFGEPGNILLHVAFMLLTLVSAGVGGYLGSWLRLRLRNRRAAGP
jgi:hypothetical protein